MFQLYSEWRMIWLNFESVIQECSTSVIHELPKCARKTSLPMLYPWHPLQLLLLFNPCVSLSLKAVDLKTSLGAVHRGPPKDGVKPGCTLTISDEDFVSIASGKLSAQKVCKLLMGVG